jgi:polyphosphate kinase
MSERMINRELSWLEFNRRVLEEAQDPTVPLLERVKFLSIFSSNLDEFFMVRVADLKQRIWVGDQSAAADGLSPSQTLAAVSERVHALVQEQHRCFLADIQPRLVAEGIRIVRPKEVTPEQIEVLDEYFSRTLLPVVTPLAIDPGHPFPHLVNRALCLIVSLRPTVPSVLPSASLAVIHIPAQVIPRFIRLPSAPGEHSFMLLEDVIRLNLHRLYHGYEILSAHAIRVTRDADVPLLTGGRSADDLLKAIEESLRERRMGDAVRLQYDPDLPPEVLARLVEELELEPRDLYAGEGFTAFTDLGQLYATVDLPRLKDRPLVPHPVRAIESAPDVWSAIREGDILVHHPYQPFDVVTRFVQEAATDPRVLAINMTLYRVSPTSPIAKALTFAAQAGKEVAVLVELRARFDEEANIRWAQALEEVGAHVVYGIPGYKTHCKACLIVRQEPDGIRRYCHLSTGNYNVRTGGIYADLGLFTCREAFGEDLTELFNLLTGYTRPVRFNHLLVAPIGLRNALVEKIRREAARARGAPPGSWRRSTASSTGRSSRSSTRRVSRVSGSISSSAGPAASGRVCRDCRSASRWSRSSTASSSTPGSSTSRTGAPRSTTSPPPTGCRATSTTGSRWPSPFWIPSSSRRSARSWKCSSRTLRKPVCSSRTGPRSERGRRGESATACARRTGSTS